MSHLHDYKFYVGYHAGWTKHYDTAIVDRLKLQLRDKLRSVFTEEIMDSWESPRRRLHAAQEETFGDLRLDTAESALAEAIGKLKHPEHESEAPLAFVRARLAQVNEIQDRRFVPETTSDCVEINGCLYCDRTWTKVGSFAMVEDGRPWMVEATDSVSGRTVIVQMLAILTYDCRLPSS